LWPVCTRRGCWTNGPRSTAVWRIRGRRERSGLGRSPETFPPARPTKVSVGAAGGFSKTPKVKPVKAYLELAKKHHRCYGCAFYVPPNQLEAHRAKCPKNAVVFNRRMGQLQGQLQRQLQENPTLDPDAQFKDKANK
jgi:hypothetical protein